jgi:hypothetical protein
MGISASSIDYDSFQEASVTTSKAVVKVFSMSDIHGDSKANSDFLQNLDQPAANSFTVFICNGDLCTDISTLRKSFQILKNTYDEVCFVPGNHELWRRGTEEKGEGVVRKGNISYAPNSLSKFNEVIRCARQCGVRTGMYVESM